MSKFCTSCGRESGDEAAFCEGCGHPFPSSAQAPASAGSVPSDLPPSKRFTAQLMAGEHKHILLDLVLTDDSAGTAAVATKTSMMHEKYDVKDSEGRLMGRVERKMHFNEDSFPIADGSDNVLWVVQSKGGGKGRRPAIWIEDSAGNSQADLQYDGLASFNLVKFDGTPVLRAEISAGGGIRDELSSLSTRKYAISLFDQTIQPWQLAALFAAIEAGMNR